MDSKKKIRIKPMPSDICQKEMDEDRCVNNRFLWFHFLLSCLSYSSFSLSVASPLCQQSYTARYFSFFFLRMLLVS